MKRILSVLLALTVVFALVACGDKTDTDNSNSQIEQNNTTSDTIIDSNQTGNENNNTPPTVSNNENVGSTDDGHTHTYSEWIEKKAPTENEVGKEERKCKNCEKIESRDIPKLIKEHTHNYISSITKQASCKAEGVKTFSCSCGAKYTEKIGKTNHNYKAEIINPTCTTAGYTKHTCKACGNTYTDSKKSALGHSWGKWTTTKKPTTSAEGQKTRKCSICGQTATASIPKLEATAQEIPQRILELVNIEREKVGLSPLQYYNAGQFAADIRAEEIIETFSHTRPDGTTCFTVLEGIHFSAAGENIAIGYRTPEQVMDGWMNSQGHKENILRNYYTHLIVGYDDEAKAWVQLFLTL